MKAVGNGKKNKLNDNRSLLNCSGKAFTWEGVGILQVFSSFRYNRHVGYFFPPQMSFSLFVYLLVQRITDESLLNSVFEMELLRHMGKGAKY